ncbi:MAG: hypothetical protein KGO93_07475 [Cyanobacteria bacterium REEB446]|nr:hypothetical protein [Cyanobacteria bacterium REEB446]
MAFKMELNSVNPSVMHAQCEFYVELNQDILSDLEMQMNDALGLNTDAGRVSAAALRIDLSAAKSLLGFWRNEAQFWKSEIDENKKDIQATNKLASGSG